VVATLVALLTVGTCLSAGAAAQEASQPNGDLLSTTVGFSEQVFGKMDIRDIKAATRTWAEIILRRETGRSTQAESRVYSALPQMERDLVAKELDLVALLPQEYLQLKGRVALEPIMLAEPPGGSHVEYVVLTRKERGFTSLGQLRGARLAIEALGRGMVPWLWLESALRRAGLPPSSAFFSGVREEYKGSQAVLAVFFKTADACVTARHSFETMAALNPQVGAQLAPLIASPGFAHGLMALRPDIDEGLRGATYRGLANLHTHATGRQVLTLFRAGRMIPFKPEQLKSVEDLLRESRHHEGQSNG
jgi:phosphonate transport system substrate-binding protein